MKETSNEREHKTIERGPIWTPLHLRKSRFGGGPVPPRRPDLRMPLLWLSPYPGDKWHEDLYLVNASGEMLDEVRASTGGWETCGDDVVTISGLDRYVYRDIPAGAAVKIDEYHVVYDSDYVLAVGFTLRSKTLGHLNISAQPMKGGFEEVVLLWDSGETGKDANIKELGQPDEVTPS